jgi:hypothetical protein
MCGTPFFPRILVRLVGLCGLIPQRPPVPAPEGRVLEPVPQVQQLGAVAFQLAGQLRRRHALGEPPHDQDQLAGSSLDAVERGVGEGVEDPAAVAAAIVQDRGPTATVHGHAIVAAAPRASQTVGVKPVEQLGVAGVLVHEVGDREVHGRLRVPIDRARWLRVSSRVEGL